jgi:hypothetical protein
MQIWEIIQDGNNFRSFELRELSPEEYDEFEDQFRSDQRLTGSWTPMKFSLFEADYEVDKPIGDFSGIASVVPLIVSSKTRDVLSSFVKDQVEFLPIETEVGDFQALNVMIVDCLDHSKSKFKRFNDGRIMRVEKYAFKPETLKGLHIFRIPEEVMSRIYVDKAFKEIVEENSLTGLDFNKIPMVNSE